MATDNPTYSTAVANIQRYLRRIAPSTVDRELFSVPVDGIYGSRTRDAISEFQRITGLPATGVVNKATWDSLFGEYQRITLENDQRISPDFFPAIPPDYETDIGERSSFVTILQLILDELRISYDTLPPFAQNGIFDTDTSLAVKEFQRIHLLPQTGRVNRRTWNAMSEAFNIYAR